MVINFNIYKINQNIYKLTQTFILIKKKKPQTRNNVAIRNTIKIKKEDQESRLFSFFSFFLAWVFFSHTVLEIFIFICTMVSSYCISLSYQFKSCTLKIGKKKNRTYSMDCLVWKPGSPSQHVRNIVIKIVSQVVLHCLRHHYHLIIKILF